MHTPSLDISLRVSVPIELVWSTLITPKLRDEWWPESRFTPSAGAEIRVEMPRSGKKKPRHATGTITSIDATAHELHATWVSTPSGATTKVHLLVSEAKQRCKIRVVEEGFSADRDDAQVVVAQSRDGWRDVLAALAGYLEDPDNRRRAERAVDEG